MTTKKRLSRFHCTREFLRAAEHRFAEARWILDQSKFTTAAVYLAGYSIECALKAVLLANTPAAQHKETKQTFRGKVAHDYDWLSRRLNNRGVVVPDLVSRHIARVNWWSTDLRYQSTEVGERAAARFLDSAADVIAWAKRST